MKRYLVTGAAGFIGFHVSRALLERGEEVVGFDEMNEYYDLRLKRDRLDLLFAHDGFTFYEEDLSDSDAVEGVFHDHEIGRVVNLAAQAGVRYSLKDPHAYVRSNLKGFLNLLEAARRFPVENFVYASSSSVYGKTDQSPFRESQRVDTPVSLYAATKRAGELMAYSYHHLYDIPLTGLRLFTVYGPWGRPDMALFIFTKAILEGMPIQVFNHGKMQRDFTYIDDIVAGILASVDKPFGWEVFNLGNSNTVELMEFIFALEEHLGMEAKKEFLPMQPGDVQETAADITKSREMLGFDPKTDIREGIGRFVEWYREYYRV